MFRMVDDAFALLFRITEYVETGATVGVVQSASDKAKFGSIKKQLGWLR